MTMRARRAIEQAPPATNYAVSPGFTGILRLANFIVVEQNACRRAVGIVELSVRKRPEKRRKTGQAEADGERNEDGEAGHDMPLSRSELATTTSDDSDMATAAMSGVT